VFIILSRYSGKHNLNRLWGSEHSSQFKSFSPKNTDAPLAIAQKKSINFAQNKQFFLKYLYFLSYLIKVPYCNNFLKQTQNATQTNKK